MNSIGPKNFNIKKNIIVSAFAWMRIIFWISYYAAFKIKKKK